VEEIIELEAEGDKLGEERNEVINKLD